MISDLRNIKRSVYYHFKDGFEDWTRVAVLDKFSNVDKSIPCIVIRYVISNLKQLQLGDPTLKDVADDFEIQIFASGSGELEDMADKCLKLLESTVLWVDYSTAFPDAVDYDESDQQVGILTLFGTPNYSPVDEDISEDELNRHRGVVRFSLQRNNK